MPRLRRATQKRCGDVKLIVSEPFSRVWLPAWPEIVVTCSSVAVAGSQRILEMLGFASAVDDEERAQEDERNTEDGSCKGEMVCAAGFFKTRTEEAGSVDGLVWAESRDCMRCSA